MKRLPRSEWVEELDRVNARIASGFRLVDTEMREVTGIDYTPMDDVIEVDALSAGHLIRIVLDRPIEVLVSEESAPATGSYLFIDCVTDSFEIRRRGTADDTLPANPPDQEGSYFGG